MQLAILGEGNVGGALGRGWGRTGHAISYGAPDPADPKYGRVAESAGNARLGTVSEAVRGVDVIVLATPFNMVEAALAAAGDLWVKQ